MFTKTVYIEKPSQKLLEFVRKLQADKEERKRKLLSQKDDFFPKK